MIDKRTGWMLFIVITLIIIRLGVSWQGSESSTPFFQLGGDSYELDTPEQRKVLMLKNHPILEQTSSSQALANANLMMGLDESGGISDIAYVP